MPNRILKESIRESETIDSLSWFEEVLFYRLIVSCDDYGRYDARPAIVKNKLFPLKENLTIKNVSNALNALARVGLVTLYEFEGKPFLFLPTWEEHQTIRAKRSKYPDPATCKHMQADASTCKQMQADVPVIQSNTKSNPNPNTNTEKARSRFVPPTKEEVAEYVREKGYHFDPDAFFGYYDSQDWKKANGQRVTNWKQCCVTWESRTDKPKSVSDAPRDESTTILQMRRLREKINGGGG